MDTAWREKAIDGSNDLFWKSATFDLKTTFKNCELCAISVWLRWKMHSIMSSHVRWMLVLVDIANLVQNPAAASFDVPQRISIAPWFAKTSENETICSDLMFENAATIDSRFIAKQFFHSFLNFSHLCLRSLSHFSLISWLFYTGFRSPSRVSFLLAEICVLVVMKHREYLKFPDQERWKWELNMALRNPSSDHFKPLQHRSKWSKCENIDISALSVMRRIEWYSICDVSFQIII